MAEKTTWLKLEDKDLLTAVGEAVGAASACWDNLEHAGVFDSKTAGEVVDQLMDRIEQEISNRMNGEKTYGG